jgi:hypothetical protein
MDAPHGAAAAAAVAAAAATGQSCDGGIGTGDMYRCIARDTWNVMKWSASSSSSSTGGSSSYYMALRGRMLKMGLLGHF